MSYPQGSENQISTLLSFSFRKNIQSFVHAPSAGSPGCQAWRLDTFLKGNSLCPPVIAPSLYLVQDGKATRMVAWRLPRSLGSSVSGHLGAMCWEQISLELAEPFLPCSPWLSSLLRWLPRLGSAVPERSSLLLGSFSAGPEWGGDQTRWGGDQTR